MSVRAGHNCKAKPERLCEPLAVAHSGYQHDGGFAEFMLVPAKITAVGGVNRIPDDIGFAAGSLAEPLACVPLAVVRARCASIRLVWTVRELRWSAAAALRTG